MTHWNGIPLYVIKAIVMIYRFGISGTDLDDKTAVIKQLHEMEAFIVTDWFEENPERYEDAMIAVNFVNGCYFA